MAPKIVDMSVGMRDSPEVHERIEKLKGKTDRDLPDPIRRLRAVLEDAFSHARFLGLDVEDRKQLNPQIARLIRCKEFPVSAGHAIVAMRSACRQAGESWSTMDEDKRAQREWYEAVEDLPQQFDALTKAIIAIDSAPPMNPR